MDLLILKFRILFDNFLKPVPRHLASKSLRYGGTVQLFCPDAKSAPSYFTEYSDTGLVLAVTIDPNEIERVQSIFEDMAVVGSPIKQPCIRNAFIIESDEGKRNEEPVCYGDTFYLRSVESTEFPLYVEVGVLTLGGATGKCGNPTAKLKLFRSNEAREKRASCFDLQTFTVHFPANRYKRISLGRPGHYPIALIPGQNTDYYKKYTSNELKYFPLNTVLYGPVRPNERHFGLLGGSDGSQSEIDDSSSSDESSSSSSEETQDTDATSSTVDEEVVNNVEDKTEKLAEVKEEKGTLKIIKNVTKTPKGRGRGKVIEANTPVAPKKRLGRPPKIKVAAVKVKKLNHDEIAEVMKEEKTDIATRVIIHTCKMCHEEESKNKNGEFENFIECSQCKGKIHPSCIDLTAEMIPKISSYGWQCTDCKSCVHCEKSSNEDKMIFCDQCDRGYHIFCVGLSEVPSGNYICHVCKPESPEKV